MNSLNSENLNNNIILIKLYLQDLYNMKKFWGIFISECNKKRLPRIFKFEDKILAVITLGAMLVKGAEYSVNRNDRHKGKTFN